MNHLIRSLTFGLLCCMLLGACATQTPASLLPASATPVPATATIHMSTQTALPTASPTPQPVIEPVTIPACAEDGTGDTVTFNELLESLAPTVNEMDSYRYRTLYRYMENDHYADEELSVEVEGAHDGLLTSPVESIFPFGSQSYESSNIVLTDLRSGRRTETIVTEDGFWVLGPDDPGWVAFDPAMPADLSNLAEMFSPQAILFMVGGGGSLAPGARAEAPVMMQAETLDGREVTHRCWILPTYEDYDFNAYLIHWENTYTFLSDAEVHLWTTKDDTRLVRLTLTGKHIEERQGLTDYAEQDKYAQHNPPRDFLLWTEISDVDDPIEIEPPSSNQVSLTIPAEEKQAAAISAPYNDLPLPASAERVGVFGGDLEMWPPERLTTTPREYRWPDYTIQGGVLDEYFGPGWHQTPADRRPRYEAEIALPQAAAFYTDQMSRRGWLLEDKFYQAGWPVLYLFFERDGVTLPVILEAKNAGTTSISAILPPADDILEATLSGWTTYTTQNSDLSSDSIQAIAFDAQGRAWIGTANGLSAFDGKAWSTEKRGSDVSALAVDPQGRVWIGTETGTDSELSVFDGKTWQAYNPPGRIKTIATDKRGRVWSGSWDSGVSLFDGKIFTNYSPGEIGLPDGHSVDTIASDPQDQIWIGTSGGGVYMFDGKSWNTVLKAKSPPHTSYSNHAIQDMAIDQQGQVWIGTGEGLSVFNGEDWITFTPENSGLPFNNIQTVGIDAHNRVWVGGYYGAVSVLETDGTWNTYTPIRDAASGLFTNEMVADPGGRIWVGTAEGLNIFTPPIPPTTEPRVLPDPTPLPPLPTPMPTPGKGWTTYTTENSGLISNEVSSVAVDGEDRVWVGTSGGVSVFSPTGEWTHYTLSNSALVDDRINALAIDAQGGVWMGTGYGLAVMASGGAWETYYTPDDSGLSEQAVDDLLVDGQGRVWIAKSCSGSCDALSVLYPDGKWSTYTTEDSDMASDLIYGLALDKNGRVWMTTSDGVSVLAPDGQWANYTKADLGLASDDVWVGALGVDKQDRVWIGSYSPWSGSYGSGLVMLAPDGSREAYTTENSGLESDDILALLVDDMGRVWVGTGAGLSVLSPDGRWTSYTPTNSGLINGTISSLAVDSHGRVWIGTDAGLSVFVPNAP